MTKPTWKKTTYSVDRKEYEKKHEQASACGNTVGSWSLWPHDLRCLSDTALFLQSSTRLPLEKRTLNVFGYPAVQQQETVANLLSSNSVFLMNYAAALIASQQQMHHFSHVMTQPPWGSQCNFVHVINAVKFKSQVSLLCLCGCSLSQDGAAYALGGKTTAHLCADVACLTGSAYNLAEKGEFIPKCRYFDLTSCHQNWRWEGPSCYIYCRLVHSNLLDPPQTQKHPIQLLHSDTDIKEVFKDGDIIACSTWMNEQAMKRPISGPITVIRKTSHCCSEMHH